MEKMAEVPKALQPRSHSAEESDGCSAMELGRNRVIRRNHVVTASELVDGAGLGDLSLSVRREGSGLAHWAGEPEWIL